MRAIAIIALLTITTACYAAPEQPSPAYWVFSWSSRGGVRRYTVVSQADKHTFMVTFNRSLPGMLTVPECEARLRALPKGVLVGFGDATCVGITYPANDIMLRIEQFAAVNNIRLILIPGVCE